MMMIIKAVMAIVLVWHIFAVMVALRSNPILFAKQEKLKEEKEDFLDVFQ